MTGFVGSRAKKRRRNFFLSIIIIIIVSIFIFFSPSFEINNNQIVPKDNIIPDPKEDLTSLVSNIEDLELSLFQKDQKINFRDGQIKNLQTELENLKSKNDVLILELKDIKNETDNKSLISSNKYNAMQENLTKINLENDKNISKIKNLNQKINNLNDNIFLMDKETNDIILEYKKLKNENENLIKKNIKLKNTITDLENNINIQKNEIEIQLNQIKELKDNSHHGG